MKLNYENAPCIAEKEAAHCPICGSIERELYASGYDYELNTCSNLWRFDRCKECSNVWLNPRPENRELQKIYPEEYYSYSFEERINAVAVWAKEIIDRTKLNDIFSLKKGGGKSYMDVGCGTGRYLFQAEHLGIPRNKIYGLELNADVVNHLRDQGYAASCSRVEEFEGVPLNSLDIVTMFHVIEHVEDPVSVVKKVSSWLSDDGVLVLETPNTESLDALLFKGGLWGGYHIPRHWNLFSPTTIKHLLNEAGLEIDYIHYTTGHSFWMYSFHHTLKYKYGMSRLARLFDPLNSLVMLSLFTAFDMIRGKLGFKTSAMLVAARKAK